MRQMIIGNLYNVCLRLYDPEYTKQFPRCKYHLRLRDQIGKIRYYLGQTSDPGVQKILQTLESVPKITAENVVEICNSLYPVLKDEKERS